MDETAGETAATEAESPVAEVESSEPAAGEFAGEPEPGFEPEILPRDGEPEGFAEEPQPAPIPAPDERPQPIDAEGDWRNEPEALGAEEAPEMRAAPAIADDSFDDDFSPFAQRDPVERRGRGPLVVALIAALLIAAVAAAFWFLAPPEWKQRIGLSAGGDTPLQLMMTHSDRQRLASGNELLAISGRVINPTDRAQDVPPITAQLHDSAGKLVYSWTIAPPAPVLKPGASASFNSAEVNVPAGGNELTVTLGTPKAG